MITSFRDRFGFLSNMYPCTVEYRGLTYPSAENAFQAQKCIDPKDRERFTKCSPGESRKIGRRVILRPDWHEVRLPIMREILRSKFSDPKLRSLLVSTGNKELIETNAWKDTFWGVYQGVGENHLGKLLMEIRREILPEMCEARGRIAFIGTRNFEHYANERAGSTYTKAVAWAVAWGYTITTGGCVGCDQHAGNIAYNLGGHLHLVLPWESYEEAWVSSLTKGAVTVDVYNCDVHRTWTDSVIRYHPHGSNLSGGALALHARNFGIVEGTKAVVALPSNKPGGGGTGQGMRIAKDLGIPLFDLSTAEGCDALEARMNKFSPKVAVDIK